jgi:NAD(P)-dependent dehydrogenase (short-subunit alcohol dehydrogenase family)
MASSANTAVVTGATGQLGRAIVAELTANAINVVAISRHSIEFRSTTESKEIAVGCDLATSEGARHLAEVLGSISLSRISIINCVGYFPGYRNFLDIDYGEADKIIRSNFTTVYFTAISLIPLLLARGGGHFISFSSLSTEGAYPLMTAFDSAKAALEQLTRHLANEFGNGGVHANVLALATLKTPEEIKLKPKGDHDHWVDPTEVAVLVRQLLSGDFKLLNGNVIKCYHYSRSYYETSYYDRITP